MKPVSEVACSSTDARCERSFTAANSLAAPNEIRFFRAFGVLEWLQTLSRQAWNEYALHPVPENRRLQTGEAWRTFSQRLLTFSDLQFVRLFSALLRFANTEVTAPARTLFRAYIPLSLEHEASGEYIGRGTLEHVPTPQEGTVLVRRTLQRWCEWVDALNHLEVHEAWHRGRPREQADPDRAAILLWPLHRRHGWTLRDLMCVLRLVLRAGHACPFHNEPEFNLYLRNLGLRGPGGGSKAPGGFPPGYAVALRFAHCWGKPSIAGI